MKIVHRYNSLFTTFKLRDKFILSYILLLLVPVITVTSVFYSYYTETSERQTRKILEQTVNQTNLRLQNVTRQITDLGNYVLKAYSVQDFLSKENYGTYEEVQEGEKVDSIKQAILGTSNVLQVRLYIDDRKVYARQRSSSSYPLSELPDNIKIYLNQEVGKKFHWTLPYKIQLRDGKDYNVITYVISVYDALNINHLVGVLCIDMTAGQFKEIINEINMGLDEVLVIADPEGKPFVMSGNFQKNETSPEAISHLNNGEDGKNINQNSIKTYRKSGFTVISSHMEMQGWNLVFAVSDRSISKEASRIAIFVAVIIILVLFAAVISSVLVSNGITLKIRKLSSKMKNIHETYLVENSQGEDGYREDEIGILDRNFNRMLDRIRQLARENYEAGLLKKDMELRLLQSQINPHFLYNVLESINWMSIREKNYKVSEVISLLGRYYRLSLSKGRDIISLAEEFEHTKLYIDLQKNRFEDRILSEIEMEPGLEACKINKLVLQPLVENAIEHGILNSPAGKGEIRIDAEKLDGRVAVRVINTGNSIHLERVEKCLAGEDLGTKGGYGLKNVNDRIKLTFGQEYGLRFRTEGEWTIAEVWIPYTTAH